MEIFSLMRRRPAQKIKMEPRLPLTKQPSRGDQTAPTSLADVPRPVMKSILHIACVSACRVFCNHEDKREAEKFASQLAQVILDDMERAFRESAA